MDILQLLSTHPMAQAGNLAEHTVSAQLQNAADASKADLDELRNVAQKFEGIFVQQILKQMQETIENASFDPEDGAGKQVHGMYCTFMADAISQQGGFGMWEQIYEQLVQMKEGGEGHQAALTQLDATM